MNLENLRRKPDFLANDAPAWVREFLPRVESLTWFVKDNKPVLEQAGAIVKIGRTWFVNIAKFPDAARSIIEAKAATPK